MSCSCRYELNDKGHYGKCAKDSKYHTANSIYKKNYFYKN